MNVSFNAGKKGRLVLKIFALGWKTWKKCIIKQDKNKNTFYETKKKKKEGAKGKMPLLCSQKWHYKAVELMLRFGLPLYETPGFHPWNKCS